ncbi:hypothetical protein CSQ79_04025 [Gloeocapsopsis sp. IPPAS B-1203]|nr:hypothetical protein CSQ79_04025 [Gloeocapsopsis sp. IPPAS B-1203]
MCSKWFTTLLCKLESLLLLSLFIAVAAEIPLRLLHRYVISIFGAIKISLNNMLHAVKAAISSES